MRTLKYRVMLRCRHLKRRKRTDESGTRLVFCFDSKALADSVVCRGVGTRMSRCENEQ